MIRKAEQRDCLDLAALSLQVWLHTYAIKGLRTQISQYVLSTFTEDHFLKLLDQPTIDVRVFEDDGHLIGIIIVDLESTFNGCPNSGYEIVTLYISQHFQGTGIGRKLLKEVEGVYGASFWLSTWVNNSSALEFYNKLGFEVIGELNFDLGGELHPNHVLSYSGI